MIKVRKSAERGAFKNNWLTSFHSFSFGEYYDPHWMGFRKLRVINEDVVQAGQGFATHAHRDMEIVTYVLNGVLEHKDSMGNVGQISAGDVQYMCAGSGVTHSEFNASNSELVHLLQIWILPNAAMLKPGYQQIHFDEAAKTDRLQLVVNGTTQDGVIKINQDILWYASILTKDKAISYAMPTDKPYAYLHLINGKIALNDVELNSGDAAIIDHENLLELVGKSNKSEFLLFVMS